MPAEIHHATVMGELTPCSKIAMAAMRGRTWQALREDKIPTGQATSSP